MYAFPEQRVLDRLVGGLLQEVGCASNLVSLRFDNGCTIALETSVRFVDAEGIVADVAVPLSSLAVLKLLDQPVLSARVESEDLLVLRFPEGHRLEIEDPRNGYECFHIYVGGDRHIV